MKLFHVYIPLLSIIFRRTCGDVLTEATVRHPDSLENVESQKFVDLLRQDLRRNNDDYKESPAANIPTALANVTSSRWDSSTPRSEYKSITGRFNEFYYIKGNITSDINSQTDIPYDRRGQRRANEPNPEELYERSKNVINLVDPQATTSYFGVAEPTTASAETLEETSTSKTSDSTNQNGLQVNNKAVILNRRLPVISTFAVQSTSQNLKFKSFSRQGEYSKYPNKDKIARFKKFMEKNKGLFKEFIKSKQVETQTVPVNALETSSSQEVAIRPRVKPLLRQGAKPAVEPTPDPEQLDMAAAKGGRIYQMRLKGRLCQRNVLMPEGPKYDSKGSVYLPAFTPRGHRAYPQTRPPKLLLPRCCNCCKKSVLGCE